MRTTAPASAAPFASAPPVLLQPSPLALVALEAGVDEEFVRAYVEGRARELARRAA